MAERVLATCAVTFIACVLVAKPDYDPNGETSFWAAFIKGVHIACCFVGFCDIIYMTWS